MDREFYTSLLCRTRFKRVREDGAAQHTQNGLMLLFSLAYLKDVFPMLHESHVSVDAPLVLFGMINDTSGWISCTKSIAPALQQHNKGGGIMCFETSSDGKIRKDESYNAFT